MSVEHPSPHLLIIHIHRTSCFYHQWAILCSDSIGLAAALLRSVGVIGTCWQMIPTASETQKAKLFCARKSNGRRACSQKPLRCAIATQRLKATVGDGEKIPLQSAP
jgi:hypothetical protein